MLAWTRSSRANISTGMSLRKRSKAAKFLKTLNDHVHRILRTIFATGLFDHPVVRQVPDVEGGMATAQSIAEKSIVLLKNKDHILPLNPSKLHALVLIGGHADVGVLTGGGSAQVDPPSGSPVSPPAPDPNRPRAFMRQ